mgnify:FL=1
MRLLLLALLPVPALAGLPGEDEVVSTVDLRASSDADARIPISFGVGAGTAIPLDSRILVPDLELRGDLQFNRLPPEEVEAFMRETADAGSDVPDRLAYTDLRSRISAQASWGATSRESGLRGRVGPLLVVEGNAGAMDRLAPIGWAPDYTASGRLGLTGDFGVAMPFGEEVGDPLLDLRFGASIAAPAFASGGQLSDPDDRAWALTVDDQTFAPTGLLGRETRAWGDAAFSVDNLRVGLMLGFHHRARSAVVKARAGSENWDVLDQPETIDPLVQLTVGAQF